MMSTVVNGEPWFRSTDVATFLEYKQHLKQSLKKDDDEDTQIFYYFSKRNRLIDLHQLCIINYYLNRSVYEF